MTHTVKAIAKFVRISPMKVRDTLRPIRGMNAEKAAQYLKFVPTKAARIVLKVLNSAIANAENNDGLLASKLTIEEATANQGPTIKRFMPAARGSAHPIQKSTTHISIILSSSN
jgi:large subunit ribosomal protein L22